MDGGFCRLVKTNPVIPSETQLSFQTSPVLICVDNTELSACQKVQIDGQMPTTAEFNGLSFEAYGNGILYSERKVLAKI